MAAMEELTLRPLTPADLPEVLSLSTRLFAFDAVLDPTLSPAWPGSCQHREYLQHALARKEEEGCGWLAEYQGRTAGYLLAARMEAEAHQVGGPWANLEELFVLGELRGMGIGERLCAALRDWASRQGIRHLVVTVSADNQKGLAFYRRNGFLPQDQVLRLSFPQDGQT
jgi:GNAT superfamily N-acetyltransferase